jgi:hypothetical protein
MILRFHDKKFIAALEIFRKWDAGLTNEERQERPQRFSNRSFFHQNLDWLIEQYPNKWVLIRNRGVVISADTREELSKKGSRLGNPINRLSLVEFVPEKRYKFLLPTVKRD